MDGSRTNQASRRSNSFLGLLSSGQRVNRFRMVVLPNFEFEHNSLTQYIRESTLGLVSRAGWTGSGGKRWALERSGVAGGGCSGELDGPGFGLLRQRFAAWGGIVWDYWWAWLIFCGRGAVMGKFFLDSRGILVWGLTNGEAAHSAGLQGAAR